MKEIKKRVWSYADQLLDEAMEEGFTWADAAVIVLVVAGIALVACTQ